MSGQELSYAIGATPASRPAKNPHESLVGTAPARPIPCHGIRIVTATEGKVVSPMRTATCGIFPFSFSGEAETQVGITASNGCERLAAIDSIKKSAGLSDTLPRYVLDWTMGSPQLTD
jgi:hypothetical protein